MIQIFVTGGTFDKEYNYLNGELFFKDSHIKDMMKVGRCNVPMDVKTLMMIDSLEMTDEDRGIIAHSCQKAKFDDIVITHGTDAIADTARYLAEKKIEGKTIVLMGAMIPYAFGSSSDGFFNLGAAVAFAQMLVPGVYVAMNGRFFTWDNVKKNRKTGFFEEISPL